MRLTLIKQFITGKTVLLIITVISLVGLFIAIYNFYLWKKDSDQISREIEEINKITKLVEVDNKQTVEALSPPNNQENPYWKYIKMNLIDVDLAALSEINPETKGWIQIPGTNINYPFVQHNDNKFYLNHTFNQKENGGGWVFLDSRNNINTLNQNTIIYAHGRIDTVLFATLKNILKSGWYDNKDNHIIKMSTEEHNTLWQVFSVYHIKTTSDYLVVNQTTEANNLNFINFLKNRSAVKFDVELYPSDKIITLSTCYNSGEKVVMHAKLIKIGRRS